MLNRRRLTAGLAACAIAPRAARAQDRFAAARTYSAERRGISLLVLQGDQILHESHDNGGRADHAHPLASGTKSFSGVLALSLVADGLLSLDAPCARWLDEWAEDPAKAQVTVAQLLTLTGGVGSGRLGRPPTYEAAVAEPLTAAPGTRFIYGPTPFQVFGEIVRRVGRQSGEGEDVMAMLERRVLAPARASAPDWTRQQGQPDLPSGARMTARNWARFGRHVLSNGYGFDLAPLVRTTAANPGYGLTWWVPREGLVAPSRRSGLTGEGATIAAVTSVHMAAGAGDQRLYLLPDHDMVVVRQATGIRAALGGRRSGWSDADFLTRLLG